jgi:hypothetical protein
VTFNAPSTEPAPDPWGRSVRRDRGLYGHEERRELINPAAEGTLHRASPLAGRRALQAHVQRRFGDVIPIPPAVHSGQLCAPPSSMVQAEQRVAEQQRQASEHARSLGGWASTRRR